MCVMLSFDGARLKNDITAAFQLAVQDFVDKLAQEAEAAKPAPPSSSIPDILIIKKNAEVLGWQIAGQVMAVGGWAAASEFGTGSLMETDSLNNPELTRYIFSGLWNPARPRRAGAPIVGRPKGRWKDIFGQDRHSRGTAEGRDLEGGGRYRPVKGTAWFRAIFKLNQIRFCRHCLEVLERFPMHRYIVSNVAR